MRCFPVVWVYKYVIRSEVYFSTWLTAVSFRVNTPARHDRWDSLKFKRTKKNSRINNHNDRKTEEHAASCICC